MFEKRNTRLLLLIGFTLVWIAVLLALSPIPQDPGYHGFADQRTLLGIPNFFDVVSNGAFLAVGVWGLVFLRRRSIADGRIFNEGSDADGCTFNERSERWAYVVLFWGLVLTSFGSGYYHLAPDNAGLFWDRLPMTLLFTALYAATVSERIGAKAGLRLLPLLVAAGVGSVVYWYWSELQGVGDLRPYILVQYYPALAIPLIAFLFPSRYTRGSDLIGIWGFYGVAKLLELFDAGLLALGGVVSGHTLKHLAAALAAYWILRMLRNRRSEESAATAPLRPGSLLHQTERCALSP